MNNPTRQGISCPTTDELDMAPQLLVVALADATLLAVDRALDGAHPILAATKRVGHPPPPLVTSEHLAALVLHLAAELAGLLRDYADAVRVEIGDLDLDEEPLDPF
jgi:hypothetical protein